MEILTIAPAKSPDGNQKVNTLHLHRQLPQERVLIQEVTITFYNVPSKYLYKKNIFIRHANNRRSLLNLWFERRRPGIH